jgi:hypothetical protein
MESIPCALGSVPGDDEGVGFGGRSLAAHRDSAPNDSR